MKLTPKPKQMLFALYQYYKITNRKFKQKPLSVVLPKTKFIKLVIKSGIAQKQPRAVYKNLEVLERKKLVTYGAKELKFTARGLKLVREIDRELEPYIAIRSTIRKSGTQKIIRRYQTIFK